MVEEAASAWPVVGTPVALLCGRMHCKRTEIVLKATSPLMNCSCANYQSGNSLALNKSQLYPIRMGDIKEWVSWPIGQ